MPIKLSARCLARSIATGLGSSLFVYSDMNGWVFKCPAELLLLIGGLLIKSSLLTQHPALNGGFDDCEMMVMMINGSRDLHRKGKWVKGGEINEVTS